jgi:hypothetical protein
MPRGTMFLSNHREGSCETKRARTAGAEAVAAEFPLGGPVSDCTTLTISLAQKSGSPDK